MQPLAQVIIKFLGDELGIDSDTKGAWEDALKALVGDISTNLK